MTTPGNMTVQVASPSTPNTITLQIPGQTGPAGPAGPQGVKGDIGATGPANTLTIGTVASGGTAAVTITGTAPNQVLHLTLPSGPTGAAGPTGPTGSTGPANTLTIGTVTTLAAGASATATITGTAPNQTLNLGIPQGAAGSGGTGTVSDATTTAKGIIQLSGDLAGTAAAPTVPGLANKAASSITLTAGTGLTGGGDLTANRTFAVSYGTTAGTAVQGNDARVTADQAAGTASIRTIGTGALQAAAGNHTHTSANITDATTVGKSLMTAADAATARTAIGAGTGSGNVTGTGGITTITQITQAAYTALATKDSATLYVIVG